MARPLRIQYPGAVYHLMARGNERKPIFFGHDDRRYFLELLDRAIKRYSLFVHCYCLMNNHYHLTVEIPKTNLSRAMRDLNSGYTTYINKKYKRSGHLFQGRFKSYLIEKESYLLVVARYIHLNPVEAHLVSKAEDYPWSSHRAYIGLSACPNWLNTDWILQHFNQDGRRAVRLFQDFVIDGIKEGFLNPFKEAAGGFILGSKDFVERIKNRFKIEINPQVPQTRYLQKEKPDMKRVVEYVCSYYRIEPEVLASPWSRSLARVVGIYLSREYTDSPLREISKYFGSLTPSAIAMSHKRVALQRRENKKFDQEIAELEKLFEN